MPNLTELLFRSDFCLDFGNNKEANYVKNQKNPYSDFQLATNDQPSKTNLTLPPCISLLNGGSCVAVGSGKQMKHSQRSKSEI